ncbi:sentrin-specific protease 7-like isoform X1 [Acipenser ruthenus]|uniref:sentrin-specific protease 7-like isoform X1 n=2 Tax=Acipenser ruthenus TaxID=7906 RepID=UPI0027423001|nr:sentrin-specific protease 7-like isoform X1 [Acipenser ruthenus]XP_058885835.1 sentrin-specific protease 7-like isoform X1 [Acipenser ruthenus]
MEPNSVLTLSPELDIADPSKMAVTFRIPKRKPSSDSKCMHMQSPLSRHSNSGYGSDNSLDKVCWSQSPNDDRRKKDLPPFNKSNIFLNNQAAKDRAAWSCRNSKVALMDVLLTEKGRHYLSRQQNTDCSSTHTDRSDCRSPPPSSSCELSEQSIAPTAARQTSPSKRGRPRRASDSLILQRNENLKTRSDYFPLRRSNVESKDSPATSKRKSEKSSESKRANEKCSETSLGSSELKDPSSECHKRRRSENSIPDPTINMDQDRTVTPHRERKYSIVATSPSKKRETEKGLDGHQTLCKESVLKESVRAMGIERKRLCFEQEAESHPLRQQMEQQPTLQEATTLRKHSPTGNPESDAERPMCKEKSITLRAQCYRTKPKKPSSCSSEPIVLSSDEEEGNACPTSSSSLTPTIRCLRLHAQKTPNSRDSGTASESSGSESQTGTTNESSEGQMTDVRTAKGLKTPVPSRRKSTKERDALLELNFTAVHMGKIKGVAHGCIQFMADSIIIPLKDPEEECLSLSVVTSQLQKYGIWNQSSGEDPSETHTVIFLWVSGAQAQLIQKELSAIHPVEQPSKYSEFLFVELCSPPDEQQQQLLKKLMCETGRRSEIPSLCAAVPWEEGHALFQGVSSDCPFISSWCLSQVQDQEQEESAMTPPSSGSPQKEWTRPEPSYTLCHRRTKDTYSVSVGLRPSKCWKEHKYTGPLTKLIVFPPPPTKGGIAVTIEDVECLDNGQFLNDVIIDFYLKYLMIGKVPNNVAERTHIFSSFFYKQLTRKDTPKEGAANISAQHRRHQRVKTWTRHIDIFDKDFIFVPVNQEAHWYLVVICFPGMEEPKYEDRSNQCPRKNGERSSSEEEEGTAAGGKALNGLMKGTCEKSSSSNQEKAGSTEFPKAASSSVNKLQDLPECTEKYCRRAKVYKRPCILIMDSLKVSSHERTVKQLREYLQVEWDVKMGTPRSFTSDQMTGSNCRVPLQDNSSDCGIYLLQYVESFLKNPVVHFEFPVQLERWFPRQEVKRKRDRIRDLILQLYRQQKSSS